MTKLGPAPGLLPGPLLCEPESLALNFHRAGRDGASVRRSLALFARELTPELKVWPGRTQC
jgi:hypothetical protein